MSTSNLYYKYLKLTNGDNIICTTDNDCTKLRDNNTICIVDPVILTPIRYPRGMSIVEGYVFQPWIRFSTETVFEIPINTIIVSSDIEEELREGYLNFLIKEKEDEVEEIKNNQLSSQDHVKLVDMLNNIAKNTKEDDESSKEEIKRFNSEGYTIH